MRRLEGKVAVITGSSKGIGAAIAQQFAAEGASVVVNYGRSKKEADQVVSEIEGKGGKAFAVQADIAKSDDVTKLFDSAKEKFGRIDVLVNNAGIYDFAPLAGITEEHYRKHFDLNVFGLIRATQEAVRHFGDGEGVVVNISSIVSVTPPPGGAVYSATKAAVDAITRVFAMELGPKVRVVSISPGMVDTEGSQEKGIVGSDFEKMAISRSPMGRLGKPEDIAQAATFLASSDASWMTGETVLVGGGLRL